MRAGVVLLLAAVVAAAPAAAQTPEPSPSAVRAQPGTLQYRGFTVDTSAIASDPARGQVEAAVAHQIDIVADSGVRDDILTFFRAQRITVQPGARDRFSARGGIDVDTRLPPQQPIVLHELLHAYQAFVMPQGRNNPDVRAFYDDARSRGVYPAGSYVLVNPMEFFAVTGSLYLWGHVDRPPGTREALRAAQPRYYAWLGELFGVAK